MCAKTLDRVGGFVFSMNSDLGFLYTIKHSKRAKNLRIIIRANATVSIVLPKRLSVKKAERFVVEQSEWIRSKLALFEKKEKFVLPTDFAQGGYHSCVRRARKLVKERITHLNKMYNFEFNKIAIKKQSTKWGSCSSKKNLNFNYKIVFLPSHLADYVVVHELCHLKEMNHSVDFWDLVGKSIPEYREYRRELKKFTL